LKTLILADDYKDQGSLAERARKSAESTFSISGSIFRSISDLVEPQGILAIGERPHWSWERLLAKSPAPIVILDGLQNPGNVAAVLRTAEAAGAAGVVTTPGTARLTGPKALRGASGSALRVPHLEHLSPKAIVEHLAKAGYKLYTADRQGDQAVLYTDLDWKQPIAMVLGQEGNGVSAEWNAAVVKIPMEDPVESLNVGVAAAVLLYESYRQRKNQK